MVMSETPLKFHLYQEAETERTNLYIEVHKEDDKTYLVRKHGLFGTSETNKAHSNVRTFPTEPFPTLQEANARARVIVEEHIKDGWTDLTE